MTSGLRRTAGILTLVVLSTAALGCSSSSKAAHKITSAEALGLVATDLPQGWVEQGKWQPPGTAQRQQLYACLAQPLPTIASQAASSTFKGPIGVVAFSATQVFPTTAAAAADLMLQRTKAYPACAPAVAAPMFAILPPGTTFGSLSVTVRSFPSIRNGSVAYRFTMPVTQGTTAATATGDTVTVLDGPAEVTIAFVGTSDPSVALSEPDAVNKLFARG